MDVNPRPIRLLFALLMIFPLALTGCTSLHGPGMCWPWCDRPMTGDVCQVMALWAEGIVEHPDPMNDGTPTPGFAARIYLLGPGASEPLAADGALSVRLFRAGTPLGEKSVPLEVWNIDQANLDRVLTKDGLGWGYDLWLPWRTNRPDLQQARLIVQYTSNQGKTVWSSSTDLPVGRKGKNHRAPAEIQVRSK
jgi:hypothetical protein